MRHPARLMPRIALTAVSVVLLGACSINEAAPSQSVAASPASGSPSPSTTPMPTADGPAIGTLQVEGFAEVVADRLQMRMAPSLAADMVVQPLYGDYPPGTPFPPVVIGRESGLTMVYLLAG